MYKNIIWDVDGTLFDTYPAFVAAFRAALNDLGRAADPRWIGSLAAKSLGHCISALAAELELPEEAVERGFSHHYAGMSYLPQPPFPGAKEVCEYISSRGGSNVIVTHRGVEGTVGLLRCHHMERLFKGWITSDDGHPKKPDPAAFEAAVLKYDLDRRATLAVGDREIDVIAAQGAGLSACLYAAAPETTKPEMVIADFRELGRCLVQGNGSCA